MQICAHRVVDHGALGGAGTRITVPRKQRAQGTGGAAEMSQAVVVLEADERCGPVTSAHSGAVERRVDVWGAPPSCEQIFRIHHHVPDTPLGAGGGIGIEYRDTGQLLAVGGSEKAGKQLETPVNDERGRTTRHRRANIISQ